MGQTMKVDGKVVIAGFTSGTNSYKVHVHCEDTDETMKCAARYAIWSLQQDARQGKLAAGETYHVDPDGTVHETPEQLIAKMSPEQKAMIKAALAAEEKANKAAEKKAA